MTSGRAFARAGLLGNPSDGYGGRVIAVTLPAFEAVVTLTNSSTWDDGDVALFDATVTALHTRRPDLVAQPATVTYSTSIPRQVGLSGSSALIIAMLRALAKRANVTWNEVELAKTALEVETDVLGWTAGPQDRVVQAFEGLVDMNFAEPWHAPSYQRLERALLPPLFVAWNQSMGEPSTVARSQVREHWRAGDPQVLSTMADFAALAQAGRISLDAGSAGADWPALMRRGFELRRGIWNVSDIDQALVNVGSERGAGVSFAGSGGAVVGCTSEPERLPQLRDAYQRLGAGFCVISG